MVTPFAYISIHPPRAGWDIRCGGILQRCEDFNPPTPGGVGRHPPVALHPPSYFNPPTPGGVGHILMGKPSCRMAFQSTHPGRGGTNRDHHRTRASHDFNPPTPGGVGPNGPCARLPKLNFNPPTPGGVGPVHSLQGISKGRFQSTHPGRGGTQPCQKRSAGDTVFQSTHPGRGGTTAFSVLSPTRTYFNPPTPGGVGRNQSLAQLIGHFISIHPPRAGWDGFMAAFSSTAANFNPPTPGGVGRTSSWLTPRSTIFQSTHPGRGGTMQKCYLYAPFMHISIHPPRAGWDETLIYIGVIQEISIHPPRAGWDASWVRRWRPWPGFQSTHPGRGGTGVARN